MSDGRLPVRRQWIRWSVIIALALLLCAIGWVAIRGAGAVGDLQQVATLSTRLKTAIVAGDLDEAERLSKRIAHNARSAQQLTADPVWAAFGLVPWLGANFDAVREVADIADDVADDALRPVLGAASELDLTSLGFVDGAIDLTPFAEIEKPLAAASAALSSAETRSARIDAEATLPPLADAVKRMRSVVAEASTVIGTLHGASALLPSMLGGDGPRDYVVAMQNNAELRSSGGIIGAIALLRAEGGRISLVQQASTADFPPLDAPLPLSESANALFDDGPGRYLQNITSIPDFSEAASLVATRWTDRFGGAVDGVVAVDAVVTSHLLTATGPLAFGPFTVDADNVVKTLLSDIYAAVPDPLVQDEIFAQAASGLLGTALSGANPKDLVGALAQSAEEGRVRIWSAHPEEQELLAESTLSGALPQDGENRSTVGVLFNDTTGGKMDYYATASIATAVGSCHGVPTTQVRVTWTNGAPADAATSLPWYVTAGGHYGVAPGSTRTRVLIYGPEGALPSHIDRDGSEESVQTALLGTRTAIQHEVLLAPGESTVITIEFTGEGAGVRGTAVTHTPMVADPKVSRGELHCSS